MRALFSAFVLAAAVGLAVADEPKSDVKTQLKALMDGYSKQRKELFKEFQAATTNEERKKISDKGKDLDEGVGKKAFALGRDWPKDPAAIEALRTGLQMGSQKTRTDAAAFLVAHFIDDNKLALALPVMSPEDWKTIDAKTKSRDVRGLVRQMKFERDMTTLEFQQQSGKVDRKKADAQFAEIGTKLAEVAKEFGDVKTIDWNGKESGTVAQAVERNQFYMNHLIVGKILPDVECEDLGGKKVKISDYRGKVAVLDVWTTWCGPCKAMIPHERELVETLKSKPFALISISADDEKKTLEKFLESESMPWTHWWTKPDGPLATTYQIQGYPTIFVLDAKGVIRYKEVRGKEMDNAVEVLLGEMGAK